MRAVNKKQYKKSDVPSLFEARARLSYQDFSSQYPEISQESALEICDAVVDYYSELPDTQRFHICAGPRDWQHIRIKSWTDWRKNPRVQDAEYYMPSKKTALAQEILYKAGERNWLTWLDSFPDHTQVIALLLDAQNNGMDLLRAFELSCSMKALHSVRTILFCFLVSEDQSEAERDIFLNTVRNHYGLFSSLCLEVLSDFRFQMAYPQNDAVYHLIAEMCANDETLMCLSTQPVMTIGILSAWAKLLSLLESTQEQLDQFKSTYFDWVAKTDDYTLLKDMQGNYYKREIDFLNFLIRVFVSDDRSIEKLKNLWEKKTCVYHGWNSAENYSSQQWFQHIGLVLWCIGAEECRQNDSTELAVYVLKRLNDAIPMMLMEQEYRLLLCSVFCIPVKDSPEINALSKDLIHKIYELPLLCDVVKSYLEVTDPNTDILCAMRNRLQIMSKLPQRNQAHNFHILAEQLLHKVESICKGVTA